MSIVSIGNYFSCEEAYKSKGLWIQIMQSQYKLCNTFWVLRPNWGLLSIFVRINPMTINVPRGSIKVIDFSLGLRVDTMDVYFQSCLCVLFLYLCFSLMSKRSSHWFLHLTSLLSVYNWAGIIFEKVPCAPVDRCSFSFPPLLFLLFDRSDHRFAAAEWIFA